MVKNAFIILIQIKDHWGTFKLHRSQKRGRRIGNTCSIYICALLYVLYSHYMLGCGQCGPSHSVR